MKKKMPTCSWKCLVTQPPPLNGSGDCISISAVGEIEVELFYQRRHRSVGDGEIQVLDKRGETSGLPGHHQVWEG